MREGWRTHSGEEVTTKIAKGSSPNWQGFEYQQDGVLFVTSENVRDGYLDVSQPKFLPLAFSQKARNSRLIYGDILVNIVGASIGRVCLFNLKSVEANINQAVCVLRLKPGFDTAFFLYLLQAPHVQRRLLGERSDSARPNLSLADFREFSFEVPPFTEQRKIAEILQTWDDSIEKLKTLRAAKERRLEALRYNLLMGATRVNGPRKNWQSRKLADVTRELTERNGNLALDREKVMGVSNSKGIVPMREQTVAEDIARYKRLPPRAFAYNPMRINVGSIAMNGLGEQVLVSPDYVVFACEPHGLEPDYLDHLSETRWWMHHINSGGSGSVRQRTYYADLAALQLPLPDIDEQRKIVELLNLARDDLAETKRLGVAIKRQKRGLMQKLLTGEWRVEVGGGYAKSQVD